MESIFQRRLGGRRRTKVEEENLDGRRRTQVEEGNFKVEKENLGRGGEPSGRRRT